MISIIGAGWYGCYIGMKLQEAGVEYQILEKSNKIFAGSSSMNQNRLHQGYHYPRDYRTRRSSFLGFRKFVKSFQDLSTPVVKNIYAIHRNSLMDFQTYKHIFEHEGYEFNELDTEDLYEFRNYEGALVVSERLIDFRKAKNFFLNQNLNIQLNAPCHVSNTGHFVNGKKIHSRLIIDCTYGQIACPEGFYNERFISLIYEKVENCNFGALTVMDGEFYSIYPYYSNLFTITGVAEGRVDEEIFTELSEEVYVNTIRKRLEEKIVLDFPGFNRIFRFKDYFISNKTKPLLNSDNRSTSFLRDRKSIIVNSGKIDTIFDCDSLVDNVIEFCNESSVSNK